MPRFTRLVPLASVFLLATGSPGRATEAVGIPEYPHKSFTSQELGEGSRSYWLFEPAEPKPTKAPVVVFHHGWLAVNPGVYGAWIEHLTRRGFVVIFPRYHADWMTPPAAYLPNALSAVKDALDVLLMSPGHVRPDLDRFALIGHSAGGNLSALMAAVALDEGLPIPKAVIALMPGEVRPVPGDPDLSRIPPETLLVVVAGEHDVIVGDVRAREIHAQATAVPEDRKLYVLYRTDRQGPVPLMAEHFAPSGSLAKLDTGEGPFRQFQMKNAGVDILDRFGFWRLADLTLEAAFSGQTLDAATNHGTLLRDLGHWGDGRTVKPPIVGNDLSAIPRVLPSHGARLVPWKPEEFPSLFSGATKP